MKVRKLIFTYAGDKYIATIGLFRFVITQERKTEWSLEVIFDNISQGGHFHITSFNEAKADAQLHINKFIKPYVYEEKHSKVKRDLLNL